MAETILRLQNISKYYYSDTSVTQALRKINLEFSMGEFVAITGESGGGKSTLLNVISGMLPFDEGEMYFRGEPTFQYDDQDWEEYRRNKIGFVFQDYSLINHYTALDNILAALVIQGKDPESAKEEAMDYLAQVGLTEQAAQRASQLSSGQKQRLSIARALAKNTDIIVADEPTGNLDSETGEQIVEILERLSHQKLVIMVTHNYDQAEQYVTRRIRLHDGEIVTDVPVNKRDQNVDQEPQNPSGCERNDKKSCTDGADNSGTKIKKKKQHMADFFARKNIKMQKGRAGLFFTFFLITAVVSFLFIGELLVYADDRITKEYDPDAYLQKNDTRLVVRYPDDKVLTEKDQAAISGVKYVDQVDLYDYANDVNYYIEKNKDYEIKYGSQDDQVTKVNEDGETDAERDQGVRLLDKTHFMKSSTAITKDDLSAGRLPKERNEIVLYSTDQKKLNSTIRCYFSSDNLWKEGQSCYQDLKVVGILKDKTRQVYFHPELCQMLTYGIDNFVVWGEYCWDMRYKKYFGTMKPAYVVVSDDLKDNEVRVSSNYIITSTGYGTVAVPDKLDRAFPGNGLLHIGHKDTESDSNSSQQEQIEQDLKAAGLEDTSEEAKKNDDSTTIDIKYVNDFSEQGGDFIEVSPEVYQKLRDVYNIGTTQASVYITNYSKTNKVIQALKEKGYDVISTYQVSTTKYVQEKVYKRLEVIGISCLILIVLAILQILIVRSILKIKKKDYSVLRFMGMKQKQLSRITYEEMGIHAAAAVVITLLIMFVLRQAGISFIQSMMFYYSVTGVLAYFLYNAVLLFATVFFFHRKLRYAEG
jgi:ABC-type lipoprotein export system ATPase subunit